MNISVNRGIQAVRANVDIKGAIQELGNSFEGFRADYDGRLHEIEKIIARGEFPGGNFSGDPKSADQRAHEKAFFAFIRKGKEDGLADLEVKAALKTSSDPDGGYGVPTFIDDEIEKLENDSAAMRRVAKVKPITTSEYKKLVSAGGTASGWVGETDGRSETDTPELKQVAPTIGEIYANPAVTQKTLDDVGFDVAEWLVEEISSTFSDQEGEAFITGNGVKKPRGILTYSTSTDVDSARAWETLQYIASGAASTFNSADKLVDLVHALRKKYRRNAVWLMNSNTIATVRKFKNGEGDYIWRPGLEPGAPDTLLGYPVEEDDNMPDIGADAFPIAFGNFKRGYIIVDRKGVRVLRDPYSNKPYVHFYTTKRVGGAVQNFECIKLLKVASS